jgi:hypothetical protein
MVGLLLPPHLYPLPQRGERNFSLPHGRVTVERIALVATVVNESRYAKSLTWHPIR